MFDRRLKILLSLLGLATIGVVARLAQLQVVHAHVYRKAANDALLRPLRVTPCVRGRILDRAGRVLAEDRPSWDICVPYGILAGEPHYLAALAEELKKADPRTSGRVTEAEIELLRSRISAMWPAIAEAADVRLDVVAERRERIVRRVRRIKQAIRDAYGLERLIAEERMAHPVVRGLDQPTAVEARIRLSSFPWVRILDSTQRHYVPERCVAHLLGRLEDAGPDDVFAQELSGEFRGVAGAEQLGEDRLRGVPGSIEEDIEGRPVSPPVPPQNGEDLRLTIDLWLQQQIHERIRGAVEAYPVCTGGSAVVIDVASREVLALVSYPDFDPNPGFEKRQALEMLRKTVPFRFRAVDMSYPPGSIIKPLVLAGALSDGVVTAGGHTTCAGALFPETPDRFRCIVPHGPVDATAAIAKSCNVYFYRTGEAVGVPRLCFWFDAAGLGRVSGTGLREEFRGRLPRTQSRGQARFAAVGQGELELTPIQAANMMACVASGVHQDVTLVRDDPRERPATSLGVAAEHWAVVREAMWRVVNAPGGTAYGSDKTVPPPEPWALLGKTGSAEAWARTLDTRYVCEWPDGRREEFIATDRADLRRRLAGQEPYEVVGWQSHRRWPPPEQMATHAWFAGYLVHRNALSRLGQRPDRAVALAVVLEYAGHGGSEAGPVAGDLAWMIVEVWPTDH